MRTGKKELVVSRGRDESRDGRHVSSHQAFQPIVNRRQDDVYAQWRSAKNDRVGIYHILVGKYMNDEEDPSSFPLVYWEKHVPGPSFILSSENGTGAVGNKRRNPAVFCQFSKKNPSNRWISLDECDIIAPAEAPRDVVIPRRIKRKKIGMAVSFSLNTFPNIYPWRNYFLSIHEECWEMSFGKKKKLVLHIHDSILINNSRHTRNWNIIMCNCSPVSRGT